jgi:hypothetical protein
MAFRMITDKVTFVFHSCNQIGIAEYNIIKYEKGSTHALVAQGVKYPCGIAVFITKVKGKVKHPFVVGIADTPVYPISAVFADQGFGGGNGRLIIAASDTAPALFG